MKKNKKIKLSTILIVVILGIWGIIIFYPFYNVIMISFMTEKEYVRSTFTLFPKEIVVQAYKTVFDDSKIITGYRSSLAVVGLGVPFNMLLSVTLAYGLSRKQFPGKKIINFFVMFTMYFNGGVIPTYLLIKNLGLIGSLASVILASGVNVYYMVIIKNYFKGIPDSLEEAAKIDGANDLVIMIKIYLPMATPVLTTFLLFFLVDRWNEWYAPMLYLSDAKKWPLQLVLRNIVSTASLNTNNVSVETLKNSFTMGTKMAAVVVTMGPIMIIYPFLQKYFLSGMTAGAVKG